MRIIIIVAMTPDGLIGKQGGLPWHEPEDLKHFKRTTMGHAVIMGRKTFDSVGKPLAGRRNIVITRDREFAAKTRGEPGTANTTLDIVHSLDEALELCRRRVEDYVFIVGGAQIYAESLPKADEMIVTFIDRPALTGDTYFPSWNRDDWDEVDLSPSPSLKVKSFRRKR